MSTPRISASQLDSILRKAEAYDKSTFGVPSSSNQIIDYDERTRLNTRRNQGYSSISWQDPEAVVVNEDVAESAAEVAIRRIKAIAYVVALGVVLAFLLGAGVAAGLEPLRAFLVALAVFLAWQLEAWSSQWFFSNE